MTPFQIYLILQADDVIRLIVTLTFLFGIAMVGFVIATVFAVADAPSDTRAAERYPKVRRAAIGFGLATLICMVGATTMPSTKTLAAMYVVPKLTSPAVQKEAGELYDLAKQALKQAIAPAPEKKP